MVKPDAFEPAREQPLGQEIAMGVRESSKHELVALALAGDRLQRLAHPGHVALDDRTPGEVVAAPLKGLLDGLGRRLVARGDP